MAHKILSPIIFFLSFSILVHTIDESNIIPMPEHHEVIIMLVSLLSAPLFYFYTKTLTTSWYSFDRREIIHGLPFTAGLVVTAAFASMSYGVSGLRILHGSLFMLDVVVTNFYLWLCYRTLSQFYKILQNNYSALERRRLT